MDNELATTTEMPVSTTEKLTDLIRNLACSGMNRAAIWRELRTIPGLDGLKYHQVYYAAKGCPTNIEFDIRQTRNWYEGRPLRDVVLDLREKEGLSYSAISEKLNISYSQVMSNLCYARQKRRKENVRLTAERWPWSPALRQANIDY